MNMILKWESDVLMFIQHVRKTILLRWICYLVSRHPTSDIALFNVLGVLVQLPKRGFGTTWILLLGGSIKGFVNFLGPKLPIPSQINKSIDMLTSPSRDLVSSESFFAACVFSQAAYESGSAAFASIYIGIAIFIGISRILATSQYPHQVTLGFLLGLFSTWSFRTFFPVRLSLGFNVMGIIILTSIMLIQWTLSIENNETRHFGVRREEYIDVLGSILNTEALNDASTRGTPQSHFEYAKSPTSSRRTQKKKDSFFYLSQNLKRRSTMLRYDDEDTKSDGIF